jgi:hypothetical protein
MSENQNNTIVKISYKSKPQMMKTILLTSHWKMTQKYLIVREHEQHKEPLVAKIIKLKKASNITI